MQLDDSKHKVYVYNLDDELSESEPEDGRLVFLPDIEKHFRAARIPPPVLPNKDGELAGMQLVLYSEPTSLTVSKEHDSVRKAILEARARVRQKQRDAMEGKPYEAAPTPPKPAQQPSAVPGADPSKPAYQASSSSVAWADASQYDEDAMEID